MIVDPATGWLAGVRRVLSPNHDERPAGASLSLIVVHGISLPPGEFGNGWIDVAQDELVLAPPVPIPPAQRASASDGTFVGF